MDIQRQYKRGQRVVYVLCHYGMTVVGRGLHQELWNVFDDYFIYSTLHGAKQVVVKVGDMYGFVDNKMVYLSSQWMSILKYRRYCLEVSRSKLWVVATYCHGAVIVINY